MASASQMHTSTADSAHAPATAPTGGSPLLPSWVTIGAPLVADALSVSCIHGAAPVSASFASSPTVEFPRHCVVDLVSVSSASSMTAYAVGKPSGGSGGGSDDNDGPFVKRLIELSCRPRGDFILFDLTPFLTCVQVQAGDTVLLLSDADGMPCLCTVSREPAEVAAMMATGEPYLCPADEVARAAAAISRVLQPTTSRRLGPSGGAHTAPTPQAAAPGSGIAGGIDSAPGPPPASAHRDDCNGLRRSRDQAWEEDDGSSSDTGDATTTDDSDEDGED